MERRRVVLAFLADELRTRLEVRHPGMVIEMSLTMKGDTHILAGQVASEECRGDAKRFLLGVEGVFKVLNELEVTGFLVPATDADEEGDAFFADAKLGSDIRLPGSGQSQSDHIGVDIPDFGSQPYWSGPASRPGVGVDKGELAVDGGVSSVDRFPTATLEGDVMPGAVIELSVDLLEQATSVHRSISLGSLPSGWSELRVSVQISSAWLTVSESCDGTVIVRADGTSTPARFRCAVSELLPAIAAIDVDAYFLHGTRVCGHANWSFPTKGLREIEAHPGDEIPARPSVSILPEAVGPTLSVTINQDVGTDQLWTWRMVTHEGHRVGSGTSRLHGSAPEYAAFLLNECPGFEAGTFRRRMRGIGEKIWNASPAGFREDFLRCREIVEGFPIQFVSADPHVPWELMKPSVDGADHLFLDHPVARWPLEGSNIICDRLPRAATVSFVPEYKNGDTLPSARDERDWLRDTRRARLPDPTRDCFLAMLDGKDEERIGILHFAGHGRAGVVGGDSGIRMSDGWISVDDIDQAEVKLGHRDRCLVILNACEVATDRPTLGINSGWAPALARRGFGGLVAPLWAVQDRVAFEVMKVLIAALDDSASLGEAMLRARKASVDVSVASFAYLAYGDVMARQMGMFSAARHLDKG